MGLEHFGVWLYLTPLHHSQRPQANRRHVVACDTVSGSGTHCTSTPSSGGYRYSWMLLPNTRQSIWWAEFVLPSKLSHIDLYVETRSLTHSHIVFGRTSARSLNDDNARTPPLPTNNWTSTRRVPDAVAAAAVKSWRTLFSWWVGYGWAEKLPLWMSALRTRCQCIDEDNAIGIAMWQNTKWSRPGPWAVNARPLDATNRTHIFRRVAVACQRLYNRADSSSVVVGKAMQDIMIMGSEESWTQSDYGDSI